MESKTSTETPLTRKEREFLRHKVEILVAAEEVFSEKGYIQKRPTSAETPIY